MIAWLNKIYFILKDIFVCHKKYIVLTILLHVILLFYFCLPHILYKLPHINSQDVVANREAFILSYQSSFAGSLASSLVAIVGIILTIWSASSQSSKDRRLQVRPFFELRAIDSNITDIGKYIYNILDSRKIVVNAENTDITDGELYLRIILQLKNVGLGPAIHCNVQSINVESNSEKSDLIFKTELLLEPRRVVHSVMTGDEANCYIELFLNNRNNKVFSNFKIFIELSFSDLLQNEFVAKIELIVFPYELNDSWLLNSNMHYLCPSVALGEYSVMRKDKH